MTEAQKESLLKEILDIEDNAKVMKVKLQAYVLRVAEIKRIILLDSIERIKDNP